MYDKCSGKSTYHRYVTLIDNAEKGIKNDGTLFDALLQALRECGGAMVADELLKCYSKFY